MNETTNKDSNDLASMIGRAFLQKGSENFIEFMHAFPQTYFEMNIEGKFLYVNNVGLQTFGYSNDDISQGLYVFQMVDLSEIKKLTQRFQQNVKVPTISVSEYKLKRKNGSSFQGLIYTQYKIKEPEPAVIIGIIVDISERVKIEEQLKATLIKAEEANRLKSAILANLTHEFRTPLNTIIGFTQLLSKSNIPEGKLRNYIDMISNSSNKLLMIINDMLDLAYIESNDIKLIHSTFQIKEILLFIEGSFSKIIEKKSLEFIVECNNKTLENNLYSDKNKIQKIVYHLVDNAIKFTNQGFVKLSIVIEAEMMEIEISDSGIGIDNKQHEKVFESFLQLETPLSRSFGGNGIGLSLVKSFVKMLNGNIQIASEINHGTKIKVSLPKNMKK